MQSGIINRKEGFGANVHATNRSKLNNRKQEFCVRYA